MPIDRCRGGGSAARCDAGISVRTRSHRTTRDQRIDVVFKRARE
ncbi:conserved hypothetical protein [Burkholderia cepacia]